MQVNDVGGNPGVYIIIIVQQYPWERDNDITYIIYAINLQAIVTYIFKAYDDYQSIVNQFVSDVEL